jgi:hypothetical protein
VDSHLQTITLIAGVVLTALVIVVPAAWRSRRRNRDVERAVLGEKERPGVEKVPSMVQRFEQIADVLAKHGQILAQATLLNGKGDAVAADVAAIRAEQREQRESTIQGFTVVNTNLAEVRRDVRAQKNALARHVKAGH